MRKRYARAGLIGLLLACLHTTAYPQEAVPRIESGHTADVIVSDGVLDEAAWADAPELTGLLTVVPAEKGNPTRETCVRVLCQDRYLLVGVECEDDPGEITVFSRLRDANLASEDYIRIIIDPFQDGQSGYIFMVNPRGARYDALVSNRGESESKDWDGIWEAGTTIHDFGWSAEIKIPIQSINFKKGLQEWGFNIERNIQRRQEIIRWANVSRDQWFTQTSRAGLITGIPDFSYGVGLNIQPSLIGNWVLDADRKSTFQVDPALTVSQRLGPNILASATVNTDFAETEVDTRQANLTRFPLFFPEKRAFFLEGSDIFEFGLGLRRDVVPFFSRRIGLLEDVPVPILAGGKVNGRIRRTAFGGIVMHTDQADIPIEDDSIRTIPRSTLGVVRVRQNVLRESSVGFLGSVGDPQGRAGAFTSGFDFTYQTTRFQGNRNFLAGVWGLIAGRQDLAGDRSAYGFKIDYPNDIWDAAFTYTHIGDGFDPSVGFVPRAGVNKWVARLTWAPRPGWRWLRQMRHELFGSYITGLGGRWQSYEVFTAPLNWRFESGERFEFNLVSIGERLSEPFEITGDVKVPVGSYEFVRYRLEADIAAKRKLNGRLTWWFGSFFGGRLDEYQVRLSWTPAAILTFELSGVRNLATLPFGRVDQTLVGLRVRVNVTPDLQMNSFLQYDTDSGSLGVNARLHWIFHPQGEFFFVFNNVAATTGLDNRLRQESSQLIAKVRYNFRL